MEPNISSQVIGHADLTFRDYQRQLELTSIFKDEDDVNELLLLVINDAIEIKRNYMQTHLVPIELVGQLLRLIGCLGGLANVQLDAVALSDYSRLLKQNAQYARNNSTL